MHLRATCCLVVGLAAIAGCSRQESVACNTDPRYATARSAPPVQIPDDLSPPNENDALRLPAVGADTGGAPGAGGCLETPPSFFGESRPFELDADAGEQSRRSRREARREERREERGTAAADRPATTTPADPPAAPQGDDRVIEN